MRIITRYLLLFSLSLVGSTSLLAQELDHVQGDLLVKFMPEVDANQFVARMNTWRRGSLSTAYDRPVVPSMNIHILVFDHNRYNEFDVKSLFENQPEVDIIQFNHLLSKRSTTPDDPLFWNQWQYINTGQLPNGVEDADLDIDLAWDITTGGLTTFGDTIVVCVVDDGLDPDHLDFGDNIWRNYAEIPGNLMDDDNNGYVDDTIGWDVYDEDGNPFSTLPGDDHGTPVAGIIGAKGNNGIGVSGVNWDVKLMVVRGGGVNEADALSAYNYPLVMRMKYNATNGQEGAFVVATNSSWGKDGGQPDDAPLWCAMYDTMGVHGILSVGATANRNYNVDDVGDLPTACPSDYLIAVTNLDETDEKVRLAAYGPISIDLGAYSENSFTVAVPNTYDDFGGTSGAAPHVAGAIGLLYSAPCEALSGLIQQNPAAAARLVRDAILDGVTPNASLDTITTTGGRLNVNGAIQTLLANCGPCPTLLDLQASDITTDGFVLNWTGNDSVVDVELQYRLVGNLNWTTIITPGEAYQVSDLDVCAHYEVRLRALCNEDTSLHSPTIFIKTDGCCDIPLDLVTGNLTEDQITVSWGDVTAATNFLLRIQTLGNPTWTEFTTSMTAYTFTNINPCTTYEIQVKSVCSDSSSDFTSGIIVSTPGCGGCLDLDYCTAQGGDTEFDFIRSFEFEGYWNISGDDEGYGDYTALSLPHAEREKNYTISIKPGITGVALDENYVVWIDFNTDGDFAEEEKVLALDSKDTSGVSAEITVPANAVLGSTRMRVGLRFTRDPEVCDDSGFMLGEFEDYCLTIDENSGTNNNPANEAIRLDVYPNPVVDQLVLRSSDYSISKGRLTIIDQGGNMIVDHDVDLLQNDHRIVDFSNLASGMYIVRFVTSDRSYTFTRKVVKL